MVQSVRALVEQYFSAFEFGHDERLVYQEKMSVLHEAIKVGGRLSESTKLAVRESLDDMSDRLSNQRRVYSDPSWVVSDSRCLVGTTDADPKAVTFCLFTVEVEGGDASKVDIDLMYESDKVRLLGMYPKCLSAAQQRWFIWEKEIFGPTHGNRKCGKFINTCLSPFWDSEVPKYCWSADSQLALRKEGEFHIPCVKIDYLNAKIQRFLGWGEEVAYQKYWPKCRLFAPDGLNCLSDVVVRVADQLRARLDGMDGFDQEDDEEMLCSLPTMVYSYAKCEDDEVVTHTQPGFPRVLPSGCGAYNLNLTDESWEEVERAYSEDHEEFNGIRLSEIYDSMVLSSKANSCTESKIKSWNNRVFYAVDIIPVRGDRDFKVLYTLGACARRYSEVTEEEPLVLVVPNGAKVRMSKIMVGDRPYSEGDEEWERWYLKQDLMWLAHNAPNPTHATLGQTLSKLKQMVYWKNMEQDVREWIDACSQCLNNRAAMKVFGAGLLSYHRLEAVWMDDKILSPTVREVTGYYSVLTFWEDGAGVTVYALRKTKLAREAFVLFVARWCAYYGVPKVLGSDNDPALIGEVASLVSALVGVEDAIQVPLGSHGHGVENKQRFISEAIEAAEARGEALSAVQLELHVAMAQVRVDQQIINDGSSPFFRLHGQKPRTIESILEREDIDTTQLLDRIRDTRPMDAEMLSCLFDLCQHQVEERAVGREQRARYNMMNQTANKPGAVTQDFMSEIVRGAVLSYKGERVEVVDAPRVRGLVYKVQVRRPNDSVKWVMAQELRPLAAPRDENLLPVLPDILEGALVFYHDPAEDGRVVAGVIVDIVDEENAVVQIHEPRQGSPTWLPRWEHNKHKHRMLRHKEQPKGSVPFLEEIQLEWIFTVGAFTGPGFHLTEDTIHHLMSMGVELDSEVYSGAVEEDESE